MSPHEAWYHYPDDSDLTEHEAKEVAHA